MRAKIIRVEEKVCEPGVSYYEIKYVWDAIEGCEVIYSIVERNKREWSNRDE